MATVETLNAITKEVTEGTHAREEISIASSSCGWKGWICAAMSAQGCNDADAGSTGIRNRDRNARTPFRFPSKVEKAFTHGRPLGPQLLSTVVAAESSCDCVSVYCGISPVSRRDRATARLRERIPFSPVATETHRLRVAPTVATFPSILQVSPQKRYIVLKTFHKSVYTM